jgi:GAF domain-containing protein
LPTPITEEALPWPGPGNQQKESDLRFLARASAEFARSTHVRALAQFVGDLGNEGRLAGPEHVPGAQGRAHNGAMSSPAASAAAALLDGLTRALQLSNSGAPLRDILEVLVRTAEAASDGSFMGSILLLDVDRKHLRHGAAPSLPAAYNDAIDGVEIGPSVGSCGTAAYFGHAIYVTDIERDPLWENFKDLALSQGLQACWSTPFVASDGAVLGTLALYYREPRGPSEHHREIVRVVGATAAVVVENARLPAR